MRTMALCCVYLATLALPAAGFAYGPNGHRIAGAAATPLLCETARRNVAEIGAGQPLSELGLWADRIRSDARFDYAAPWHYVNVEIDFEGFEHAPEGDVLWAIGHFVTELAREDSDAIERANALKFLVHFIVDLHQPLHVGLAADRGGNEIDVRYGRTTTNLHAFWDTDVIALTGQSVDAYVASIEDRVARRYAREVARGAGVDYRAWARESLSLRGSVYRFDASRQLSARYVTDAKDLTKERLIRASARLALSLNQIFCVELFGPQRLERQ